MNFLIKNNSWHFQQYCENKSDAHQSKSQLCNTKIRVPGKEMGAREVQMGDGEEIILHNCVVQIMGHQKIRLVTKDDPNRAFKNNMRRLYL